MQTQYAVDDKSKPTFKVNLNFFLKTSFWYICAHEYTEMDHYRFIFLYISMLSITYLSLSIFLPKYIYIYIYIYIFTYIYILI